MPDVQKAWAFLEDSDPVSSAEEVEAAVRRIAADVSAQLADRYPLVLVVMGGAVVFAGQLLPKLRFPLDFDYIHASRYGAATRGAAVEWRVSPPTTVKDRAVLVLVEVEGLSMTEAAGSLGTTTMAVKWRVVRARRRLRTLLTGERDA